MKKLILLGIVLLAIVFSCQNTPSDKKNKYLDEASLGAAVFKEKCVICHGADGKLSLNGAKDLSASTLSDEEKTIQIKKGKGAMTPFENLLSEAEIKAVVKHINTLKK